MWTVYKHTAPNGKVYIGITGQKPEYRWDNGNGYRAKYFTRAIKKYGWNNFKHEILFTGLTHKEAGKMEQYLIAKYDLNNREKGYNESKGGEYGSLGVHRSAETRRKISKAKKGEHRSAETRRKLSEAHKGTYLSIKTRRKISEAKSKSVVCVETGKQYASITEAATAVGVAVCTVSAVLRGRQKTAGGYHWEYAEM